MISNLQSKHLSKISIIDKEIILNGPPSDLEGHVLIRNNNDSIIKLRSLDFKADAKSKNKSYFSPSLRILSKINPGEQKLEKIYHSLAQNTPPGTYEETLDIGGQKQLVKMIVQPNIEIGITPSRFTFQDTSPGKLHCAVFTLTNLGNMAFQVPSIKHIATLDMDFLCRAFGFAFRKKGKQGIVETLDGVTQNIKSSMTDWVDVEIPEIGKILEPGNSMTVHLNITLAANSNPNSDYSGLVRFWDKELSFIVKSHNSDTKLKANGK